MNTLQRMITLSKIYTNYRKRKLTLNTLPIRLWIESSQRCNLACVMCPNKDIPKGEKGLMDLALYQKIIDEAKEFAHDINLHHRGEPLLHPQLAQMIRYARHGGLAVRFHTNATLLDAEQAEELVAAQPDLISISFDGLQKDLYEETRRGANFERTVANVLGLLDTRKRLGARKPYIVMETIDLPALRGRSDPDQVRALVELLKVRGLDELIIKDLYEWTTASSNAPCRQTHNVCTFPWYAMVICWDGTVTPCPQDFMAAIKLGNVRDQSIRTIWNGPSYLELRHHLVHDLQSLELCRKCDRLFRKQLAGLPFQYMIPFLSDQFLGYRQLRKLLGSSERNVE
jgi:radical SAM protein with 4Fe4S-binding SPASM domain